MVSSLPIIYNIYMTDAKQEINKGSLLRGTETEDNEEPLLGEPEEPPELYKEEPWRWVNLAIFLTCSLVNCMPTHTFTPINSIVSKLYDVDKLLIALNTLIFPISHPILAFLANWVIDKYGLRVGCGIGSLLCLLGVWARCLIGVSFGFALLGSLLSAIGNIFIINSPSKLANVWFKPSMVALVTTMGVMATLASNALGVVFPTLFVNSKSTSSDIEKLLIIEAIIVSVPLVACILFMRKKPNQAPSYAAANTSATDNYKGDLKILFTNRNYILLMVVCSCSYGSLVAFITVIEYLVLPFKYAEASKTASDMLLASMVAGLAGCLLFVTALKKTHQYRKILVVTLIGCTLEIFCVVLALDTHTFWVVIVVTAFVGFFFIPQLPIILEMGCELAFPIGEATTSGFLLAGGQLLGFLSGTACIQILDGESIWKVFLVIGIFTLFLIIGTITMCFVKEDLRRTRFERKTSSSFIHHSIHES